MRIPANAKTTNMLYARIKNDFMIDSGVISHYTVSTRDVYGQPTYTTADTTVSCKFNPNPSPEAWTAIGDIEIVNAEVRIQASATVYNGDDFKITNYFLDSSYVDQMFEIIGIKDRGKFGQVCALKKVER